jgi:hypothetical protein
LQSKIISIIEEKLRIDTNREKVVKLFVDNPARFNINILTKSELEKVLVDKPALLNGLSLQGADFSGMYLAGVIFTECNLMEANFDNAYLENAEFHDSLVLNVYFKNAVLNGAIFLATKDGIANVNLDGAILINTQFINMTVMHSSVNSIFINVKATRGQVKVQNSEIVIANNASEGSGIKYRDLPVNLNSFTLEKVKKAYRRSFSFARQYFTVIATKYNRILLLQEVIKFGYKNKKFNHELLTLALEALVQKKKVKALLEMSTVLEYLFLDVRTKETDGVNERLVIAIIDSFVVSNNIESIKRFNYLFRILRNEYADDSDGVHVHLLDYDDNVVTKTVKKSLDAAFELLEQNSP